MTDDQGITFDSEIAIDLDLTNVTTEFEPLPVGLYVAHVESADYTPQSKKSGQPYIKLTWSVDSEEFEGRKLFDNYSLQPDALWKLVKMLGALGIELPRGQVTIKPNEWIGLQAALSVGQDLYKGAQKNTVVEVQSLGEEPAA